MVHLLLIFCPALNFPSAAGLLLQRARVPLRSPQQQPQFMQLNWEAMKCVNNSNFSTVVYDNGYTSTLNLNWKFFVSSFLM